MAKSWDEINARIASGEAVVVTAEEFADIAKSDGLKSAAKRVDVVTTGTFGPMCSSGAFFNFGHSDPPIKMGTIT
ncbi:MAG TPA: homocysteine biosynthesis protein, partial [Coriobacteriia bacterium]